MASDIGADPGNSQKVEKHPNFITNVGHGHGQMMGETTFQDHAVEFVMVWDGYIGGNVLDAFGGLGATGAFEDENLDASVGLRRQAKSGLGAVFVLA